MGYKTTHTLINVSGWNIKLHTHTQTHTLIDVSVWNITLTLSWDIPISAMFCHITLSSESNTLRVYVCLCVCVCVCVCLCMCVCVAVLVKSTMESLQHIDNLGVNLTVRSEERRVGKECRSRR